MTSVTLRFAPYLLDHDAEFLIVFSVETHLRVVFAAGEGVGRLFPKVQAILGA